MKKLNLLKIVIGLLLAVVFSACISNLMPFKINSSQDIPKVILFNNSKGMVFFGHESHSKNTCEQCHPPFKKEFNDSTDYSLIAHETCISCHNEESIDTACESCHHNNEHVKKDSSHSIKNLKLL